jgi:hypothetical protein
MSLPAYPLETFCDALAIRSVFFAKLKKLYLALWLRGAVGIASISGTEDPGSNPARV